MKRKRFTEEQIIAVLKEHEAGMKTGDLALDIRDRKIVPDTDDVVHKLLPTAKTAPVSKAKPAPQTALGPRPNAREYCWSLMQRKKVIIAFEGSRITQTKYGLIECYAERSGMRGAWK